MRQSNCCRISMSLLVVTLLLFTYIDEILHTSIILLHRAAGGIGSVVGLGREAYSRSKAQKEVAP